MSELREMMRMIERSFDSVMEKVDFSKSAAAALSVVEFAKSEVVTDARYGRNHLVVLVIKATEGIDTDVRMRLVETMDVSHFVASLVRILDLASSVLQEYLSCLAEYPLSEFLSICKVDSGVAMLSSSHRFREMMTANQKDFVANETVLRRLYSLYLDYVLNGVSYEETYGKAAEVLSAVYYRDTLVVLLNTLKNNIKSLIM